MRSSTALLALATGAFAIGTTEFTPMGLLPVIADGVQVSIPTAGMLVSAYAIGVMAGAPVMTLLFSRFGKRAALMSLMLIFTIGNLLSAFAPSYATLLLSRLVTSLNHGAFFGIGAVVVASVVPKEKQASAIAAMFMGLTIANIGGVPAATWIGQQVGWRVAFGGTAMLGLLTIVALWLALPKGEPGEAPNVGRELKVLTRPEVLLAMGTTVLASGAMFALYTYVAPLLAEITHASPGFVALALVLIGIGFTIGNSLGGRLADWSLDGATKLILAALAVTMAVLPLVMTTQLGAAIGLVVWGAAAFGMVPPVQMRVMQAAAQAPGPGFVCQRRCVQPRQRSRRSAWRHGDQQRLRLRRRAAGRRGTGSRRTAAGLARQRKAPRDPSLRRRLKIRELFRSSPVQPQIAPAVHKPE